MLSERRTSRGKRSVRVGIKRIDVERLPPLTLRETLANAVAHRACEARGTWTRVEIRPFGVTVRSPGMLPESVTSENIRDQQFACNPTYSEGTSLEGVTLAEVVDRIWAYVGSVVRQDGDDAQGAEDE